MMHRFVYSRMMHRFVYSRMMHRFVYSRMMHRFVYSRMMHRLLQLGVVGRHAPRRRMDKMEDGLEGVVTEVFKLASGLGREKHCVGGLGFGV